MPTPLHAVPPPLPVDRTDADRGDELLGEAIAHASAELLEALTAAVVAGWTPPEIGRHLDPGLGLTEMRIYELRAAAANRILVEADCLASCGCHDYHYADCPNRGREDGGEDPGDLADRLAEAVDYEPDDEGN